MLGSDIVAPYLSRRWGLGTFVTIPAVVVAAGLIGRTSIPVNGRGGAMLVSAGWVSLSVPILVVVWNLRPMFAELECTAERSLVAARVTHLLAVVVVALASGSATLAMAGESNAAWTRGAVVALVVVAAAITSMALAAPRLVWAGPVLVVSLELLPLELPLGLSAWMFDGVALTTVLVAGIALLACGCGVFLTMLARLRDSLA